ncbi:hypothetical protein N0V88_003430 [Collariella sp. IMI 366227]|nr:hypothetical protein N0V88_003430 [Collariella sp. IMI 366227]
MSANQSRRRQEPLDMGSTPVNSNRSETDFKLPYQGRELGANSIRLLEIQPAADESDPVVCNLDEATFGSRPKFEALSEGIQQRMVRHLRTDPYWNRLWILQEIGRARKLRVCYGDETFTWNNFMHLIAMHNSEADKGPLRLDRLLRRERYEDSHTLKRLLEEHIHAECSKPQDKIYGLVGLAMDAADFPMDYDKSLYEVWKDTMEYMNQWELFKEESEILKMGALIKAALMTNCTNPLEQISGKHKGQVDTAVWFLNLLRP